MKDIIVIGAGAAGMMAAIAAASAGSRVTILEHNPKPGRKLYITGKGRCNVTNDCTPEEILAATTCNAKFLYSSVWAFPPAKVKEFFQNAGVPLKTERGNRVFPVSDRAADIIDALVRELKRAGVKLRQDRALSVRVEDGAVSGVETEGGFYPCDRVIIATGGASYPGTGSTGDGYRMAADLGHTVIEPKGSLVPLVAEGDYCARMQGLSLRNVAIKVKNSKNKVVYQEQGELLFTHYGLSGPLILSASAHMRDYEKNRFVVSIDLKPALDEGKLDARLLREFAENGNRTFQNCLGSLEPRLMVPVLVERSGIPGETRVHSITREQRRTLIALLKNFTIPIACTRPVEEAIVTSGGVKVSELDPKTMASKLVAGLYFAGEVMDVDAYTGGFNLQIAWSTGRAAGLGAGSE